MSEQLSNSARNQFKGTVTKLTTGMVNTEVILDIGNGHSIAAVITNASASFLDLKVGTSAWALFKASWVILSSEKGLKTSARNTFTGKILSLKKGTINGEVVVDLPGGNSIASIVTNSSIERLGLVEGLEVSALVKASHVILAVK
ncbi:MAG: TOBE domain-containing protein [Deltaproteobacteria bacterium]|jgi:molybdate transport system regulatory protein|nr:TOBE domain-containing protein [Deltaproteobacteria bacterium]